MAPEVYRNEEYDTKVDVFSFALILQEVRIFFPNSKAYLGSCNVADTCVTTKLNLGCKW